MTLFALLACATDSDTEALYDGPTEGKIVGVVHDQDGQPLPGVMVTLPDGTLAETNGLGMYRFDPLDPGHLVVTFDLPGYSRQYRNVTVVGSERITANAMLREVGATFDFDPSLGGIFEHSSVRLDIPAGSLIDSMGQPYDGPATLELTGYDPLDYSAETGIPGPGSYRGLPSDGSEGYMGTAGFFEATLRSPDGEYLNLGEDSPATVEIDDPREVLAQDDSYDFALNDDDPALWWFDPDMGIWVQEGVFATVEDEDGASILTAEVEHFSWWNADYWYIDSMTCVGGQVLDTAGNPVVGATVTMASDYAWRGYYDDFYYSPHSESVTTDSDGAWSIYPLSANNPYYTMTVEYTLSNGDVVTETTSVTTPDESQADEEDWASDGTCNDLPPVVIDTCALGGDIRIAWNSDAATSAGASWFFETGDGDCYSAGDAFDLEIGEWTEVDTSVTPANVIPDFAALGLEDTMEAAKTKLKDGSNMVIKMEEVDDGGIHYYLGYQTESYDALHEGDYTFWVKGESGGISGYTGTDVVEIPPAIEGLAVEESADQVDLTWDAEAYSGGVYVLVSGDDLAVLYRVEDTGSFEWDAESAALFDGETGLSLIVYRVGESDHQMTSGDTVRALVTAYVTDSLETGPDCEGAM